MRLFRRRTIFHAEDSLPDPEELKLRFRRRILLLTFFGFLLVLTIPVVRDLKSNLEARVEARKFADWLMESRTFAAMARAPISLEFNPAARVWVRTPQVAGPDCATEAAGPVEQRGSKEVSWKLQVQQESGETLPARRICFHPSMGLVLDSVPIKEGRLLITVQSEGESTEAESKPAYILVTAGGADLQVLSR